MFDFCKKNIKRFYAKPNGNRISLFSFMAEQCRDALKAYTIMHFVKSNLMLPWFF